MMKILIVDSDAEQLEITAYVLSRQGFRVSTALDGKATLVKWQNENPDMIILETALPKINGLEVCRQIRERSQVPVIFLSERSGDQDVVTAFNVGADDYVIKPFSARQLIARIRATLRRAANTQEVTEVVDHRIMAGNLIMDAEEHKLAVSGKGVHLTRLEFRLLYCLSANKGRVVTADQLIDYAWGVRDGGDASVLKTHISRIRQKLDNADPDTKYIRSVPGVGYRLEIFPDGFPASVASSANSA